MTLCEQNLSAILSNPYLRVPTLRTFSSIPTSLNPPVFLRFSQCLFYMTSAKHRNVANYKYLLVIPSAVHCIPPKNMAPGYLPRKRQYSKLQVPIQEVDSDKIAMCRSGLGLYIQVNQVAAASAAGMSNDIYPLI